MCSLPRGHKILRGKYSKLLADIAEREFTQKEKGQWPRILGTVFTLNIHTP